MTDDPGQHGPDAARASGPEPESAPVATPPPEPPVTEPDAPVRTVVEDPWAHRRGEPRVFAFAWTMYLFIATALTMLSAVSKGYPGPEILRPAARVLMVLIAVGLAVLWPALRLSQEREPKPVAGLAQDLFVVLIPIQAVIWPQTLWWLARWPVEVVAGQCALFAAWSLIIGGVLALALSGPDRADPARRPLARWPWMVLILIVSLAGVAPVLFAGAPPQETDVIADPARVGWMFSPFTAALELGRDRHWSGLPVGLTSTHWLAIASTAGASLPLWLLGVLRARAVSPRHPDVSLPPGIDPGRPARGAGLH